MNAEAVDPKPVEVHLERFRAGEKFRGRVDAFVKDGRADSAAVHALTEAMRNESSFVREQAARMLIAIGKQADPLSARGIPIIRDPQVIQALVKAGLPNVASVCDIVLDALQTLVPAEALRPHGAALVDQLKKTPTQTAFLLIAKVKPAEAAPVVRELAASPRWAGVEEAKIAQAALGNRTLEQEFIDRFTQARDPEKVAQLARVMALIGTEPALKALAARMRTDLVIEMTNVFRRSVRLDIMAALSYAFPEQPFLYDNAVSDDSGYERVEKFCEERFGTKWDRPRPPFLTVQGFPSDAP